MMEGSEKARKDKRIVRRLAREPAFETNI